MRKVILAVIFGLILLGVNSSYAADYIPYLPWGFYSEQPSVCIVLPDMQSETWMIKPITLAVLQWQDKLNNATNSTNWNISIKTVKDDTINNQSCNSWIKIIPTTERVAGEYKAGSYALAQTGCDTVYGRHLCEIWVYDYVDAGRAFVETPQTIIGVVGHEFGHVLGLGHRSGDTIDGFVHALKANDIMFYSYSPYNKITQADLNAVFNAYGHAWDGQHGKMPWYIVWNGTLPHTCVKEYHGTQVCTWTFK